MAYDVTFQSKIILLVIDTIETALKTITNSKVYFKVPPPLPTFPLVVYHFQDGGGKNNDTIGANGWKGLVTLKSLANDIPTATNLLVLCVEALDLLSNPDYDISVHVISPLDLPVDRLNNQNVYSIGVTLNITISPK